MFLHVGTRLGHYDLIRRRVATAVPQRALQCVAIVLAIGSVGVATTVQAQPTSGAAQAGQATQPRTIAVVPFDNISGQSDDDWLGFGIAETISADLQRVGAVSLFDIGNTLSLEGARDLGFSWVITGGYQRVGDQLRVTARILDVETGATQGAAKVDGTLSNLFSLQDQIVSELINSFEQPPAAPGAGPAAPRSAESQQPPPPPLLVPSVEQPAGLGGRRPPDLTSLAPPQSPPSGPTGSVGADFEVAVSAGASIPVSPGGFDELFDPGLSFSVDVGRQIVGLLGWRAEFGYDGTSLAGADLNINFARYGGGITIAPFDSARRGMPYGFFTVGGFTTDVRGADAPELGAETDVGISFGGGYKWKVSDRWGIGGNLRVNGIFGGSGDVGGDDDAPIWYLTPSAGVLFSF